mgnify:CR=1 FL=1
MPLAYLNCGRTRVSDLSPLQGMPLENLNVFHTSVSDLTVLKGMPLRDLTCSESRVADISPLKDMPLRSAVFYSTLVDDISVLKGTSLTRIVLDIKKFHEADEIVLRSLVQLQTLGYNDTSTMRATDTLDCVPRACHPSRGRGKICREHDPIAA